MRKKVSFNLAKLGDGDKMCRMHDQPKTEFRFDDGAAYERFMGKWSKTAGQIFLDWLSPAPGLRWLDVGCGNGAFTDVLIRQCKPRSICGIDPSAGQISYATQHVGVGFAEFRQGDAMALPYADDSFDAAVMPLVIFFVPQPAKGVAEMARVVAAGGAISAYAWDMVGGGFPYAAVWDEMRALGADAPELPSAEASQAHVMHDLWTAAGLTDVETRTITVQRTFTDFADYWATVQSGPSISRGLNTMPASQLAALQDRLRQRMTPESDGRIIATGRANAVKGRQKA